MLTILHHQDASREAMPPFGHTCLWQRLRCICAQEGEAVKTVKIAKSRISKPKTMPALPTTLFIAEVVS